MMITIIISSNIVTMITICAHRYQYTGDRPVGRGPHVPAGLPGLRGNYLSRGSGLTRVLVLGLLVLRLLVLRGNYLLSA